VLNNEQRVCKYLQNRPIALFDSEYGCVPLVKATAAIAIYKRKASTIDLNVVWFDSDERSNFVGAEQPLFKPIALKSHIFSTFHPA
jgi:hypothetical protein